MKATVIIQARMNSSRLPGKVLKEVMGKPLLSYQIEQLDHAQRVEGIIIATTTHAMDDPIEAFARDAGLICYRGSELDVLDRYYQAAKKHNRRHIVRATADCPLIQPDLCDILISRYDETGSDYVKTDPSYAEGIGSEVFSFEAIERTWNDAKLMSEREHVTLYIRNHPELFKSVTLKNTTNDGKYRITVDDPEDFAVIRLVIEALYPEKTKYISVEGIKKYLDAHPDVYALNSHIVRNEGLIKSLEKDRVVSGGDTR